MAIKNGMTATQLAASGMMEALRDMYHSVERRRTLQGEQLGPVELRTVLFRIKVEHDNIMNRNKLDGTPL